MKKLTRSETALFLAGNDGYLILTHRRPDGDTVGSAALLCRGLRLLGKNAYILENPEITAKYAPLHDGLTKPVAEEGDILIAVDTASKGMLPASFAHLADRIALRIDHHAAENYTDWELVEPETAACGEVIYAILRELNLVLDEPMADALYTAVATDTGCFRYANTTENSLRVAADCHRASKNLFALNQLYFETNSLGRLRLQGYLVENAVFLQGGKVVICPLPKAVEENLGLTEDDMDNISGFPRTIDGVKIAATIRQEGENKVKISVRAVPGCDASAICARFGGGGHKGAAGASAEMSMADAVEALKEAIPNLN
jgi:phosphoesterase RecJ-like protein